MNDQWRLFESRVKSDTLRMGHAITQIPSEILQTKGRKVRKKTDCDFAFGCDGKSGFLDAKSCGGVKFYFTVHHTFSPEKIHQFNFLMECWARGSAAGYLVWLYNQKQIIWAPIGVVAKLRYDTGFGAETPGVRSQPDDVPIDLSKLAW